MHKLLSTSQFAEAIGLSESTVRRLTDGGDISVRRTKGGHRKIPVEEAIRYSRVNGIQPQNPKLLGISFSEDAEEPDSFYDALVNGDSDKSVGIIQTLYLNGQEISSIFDGPFLSAFVRIGESFPANKRSIFIEHRSLIIAMRSLMQLRSIMPPVEDDAQKVICAAPAGDPYLIPCLMCALVCHDVGYFEINLGPDTPLEIIIDAVEDEKPSLVSLSITNAIRSKNQIGEIGKLHRVASDNKCILVVGGNNADSVDVPGIRRGHSMAELKTIAEQAFRQPNK
ncbi:MAG: helix-turn-helix domain-containing protein [Pirellulaceae bacterium]|nr:helix-turn-helix domain-containing protein [Pirellulaceae bacterium]MDG2102681.1 helix-turn-helix domain-containing protein [Pirellulaceae bacterium]